MFHFGTNHHERRDGFVSFRCFLAWRRMGEDEEDGRGLWEEGNGDLR